MTYGELAQLLIDYTATNEVAFSSAMNSFIVGAENKIFGAIKSPIYWTAETSIPIAANADTFSAPDGCLDITSIRLTSAVADPYLLRKDFEMLKAGFPDTATRGEPRFYAVTGFDLNGSESRMEVRVAPTPSSSTALEIAYRSRANAGSLTSGVTSGDTTSTATTYLSEIWPDLLMFGSLSLAAVFLKNPEVGNQYSAKFDEEMMVFKGMSEDRQDNDEARDDMAVAQ